MSHKLALGPLATPVAILGVLLCGCLQPLTEPEECATSAPAAAPAPRAVPWTWGNGSEQVIAHRGFLCCYPENTLEAMTAAYAAGAPAVEVDIQVTLDGVPVLLHDPTVDRTTDGTGNVRQMLYNDVQHLNACWRFARASGTCEIPTLQSALALSAGRGVLLLDLKPPFDGCMMEAVLRDIRAQDAMDRIALLSSDLGVVAMAPAGEDIRLGYYAARPLLADGLARYGVGTVFLQLAGLSVNTGYAEAVSTSGIDLGTIGVRTPSQLNKARALGARWILADSAVGLTRP
jgi:glycerophosphoryl diester phosphodiesterase